MFIKELIAEARGLAEKGLMEKAGKKITEAWRIINNYKFPGQEEKILKFEEELKEIREFIDGR